MSSALPVAHVDIIGQPALAPRSYTSSRPVLNSASSLVPNRVSFPTIHKFQCKPNNRLYLVHNERIARLSWK